MIVAVIVAIIAATFAIDILTPPGIAAGVFPYFIAVFLTVRLPWRSAPYIVAAVASALALAGFFLSSAGRPEVVLINRAFIIVTLYIVAFLAAHWIRTNNRRVADLAAEESEARYRALFDTSLLGLLISALDGRRLRVNQAFVDLLGHDSAEGMLSEDTLSFVAPSDRDDLLRRRRIIAEGGEYASTYEMDLVRKDGTVVRAQVFARTIEWEGQPAILRTFIDISERERAVQALLDNESRYRKLFEGAQLSLQIVDHDNRRLVINQALADLLGYATPAEVMALPRLSIIAPDVRDAASERSRKEIATGELRKSYEIDLIHRDGARIRAQVFSQQVEWEGKPAILRTFIDITERSRTEHALAESEARYRNLFDGSPLAMQISDRRGKRVHLNQAAADLLGYGSIDEMMSMGSKSFVAPGERGNTYTMAEIEAADGNLPPSYEIGLVRRDGSTIRVQGFWRLIDWEGERMLQRTFVDLTERNRAEQALAENEERLRLLLDAISDGVIGLNDQGLCTFCNPAGVKLLGLGDASEIVGQNVHMLMHHSYPDGSPYPQSECPLQVAYSENRELAGEDETFWRADGTSFPAAYRSLPVYKSDALIGRVLLFRDLTEQFAEAEIRQAMDRTIRTLQQELSEESRVSAVNEVASVIAHELNQPLTAIRNTANAARRQLTAGGDEGFDKLAEMLPFLSDQASRAGEVVNGIRRLFQSGAAIRNSENLHDVIAETCAIARQEFASDGATIAQSLDAGAAWVIMDRTQIRQVLYNLLKNAHEAGSTVPESSIAIGTSNAGAGSIDVTVQDSGPGIPEDVAGRLFDPFVTTKSRGMGMGLYTCRTIVEAHGGSIRIESIPGRGTTVHFTLPVDAPVST